MSSADSPPCVCVILCVFLCFCLSACSCGCSQRAPANFTSACGWRSSPPVSCHTNSWASWSVRHKQSTSLCLRHTAHSSFSHLTHANCLGYSLHHTNKLCNLFLLQYYEHKLIQCKLLLLLSLLWLSFLSLLLFWSLSLSRPVCRYQVLHHRLPV